MAVPPLGAGAVKATEALALPAVALTMVGTRDDVAGTTALDAADARPVTGSVGGRHREGVVVAVGEPGDDQRAGPAGDPLSAVAAVGGVGGDTV